VTEDSALASSAVFCAITLLADAALLPFFAFKRRADGGRDKVPDHRVYRLVHQSPNPEQSAAHFWWFIQASAAAWGRGYAEIERDSGGQAVGLWPIHPSRVRTYRDEATREIRHEIHNDDGTMVDLADDRILHHYKFSRNGLTGCSPISVGAASIGGVLAADEHASSFFGNNAAPVGVLSHPEKLSEEAQGRLRRSWQAIYGGPRNAGKVAVIEEAIKYFPVGIAPEDAQLLETRRFSVAEVARWFNIPPHKLKDLERATFSNIEHQAIEYVVDSVLPWLVCLEAECNRKLFNEAEQADHFVKFQLGGLLRGDQKSRYESYAVGLNNGFLSPNDARQLEDMNPIEGGDTYVRPMNLSPVDGEAKEPAPPAPALPPPTEGTTDDAAVTHIELRGSDVWAAWVEDAAERIAVRESKAIAARAGKADENRTRFNRWLDKFYADHRQYVIAALAPLARAANGQGFDVDRVLRGTIDEPRQLLKDRDPLTVLREWTGKRGPQIAKLIDGGNGDE